MREGSRPDSSTVFGTLAHMAQNSPSDGLEAVLNASLERQRTVMAEQTHKQQVLLLGQSLERLLVSLTKEIETIAKDVGREAFSVSDYADQINRIRVDKKGLLVTYSQWEKLNSDNADPAVGRSVAALELTANKLIEDIRLEMQKAVSQVSQVPITRADVSFRKSIQEETLVNSQSSEISKTTLSVVSSAPPVTLNTPISTPVSTPVSTPSTPIVRRLRYPQFR